MYAIYYFFYSCEYFIYANLFCKQSKYKKYILQTLHNFEQYGRPRGFGIRWMKKTCSFRSRKPYQQPRLARTSKNIAAEYFHIIRTYQITN